MAQRGLGDGEQTGFGAVWAEGQGQGNTKGDKDSKEEKKAELAKTRTPNSRSLKTWGTTTSLV